MSHGTGIRSGWQSVIIKSPSVVAVNHELYVPAISLSCQSFIKQVTFICSIYIKYRS